MKWWDNRPLPRSTQEGFNPPIEFFVSVVDELIELGYLKYQDPNDYDEFRTAMVFSLWDYRLIHLDYFRPNGVGSDWRFYHSLDDQWVSNGHAIEELEPFRSTFLREGVDLGELTDHYAEECYDLYINGKSYRLRGSLREEPFISHFETAEWGVPLRNMLLIVNELLAEAGSPERFYCHLVRINMRTRIMTPSMFALLTLPELGDLYRPFGPEEIDEFGEYPDQPV